eukprot:CAMPEP_0206258008 /NCGR_PEP_ID=MMETSP0047_2-20121206/25675_1 /ASSEMBLY_ACC=CAM_ASM_000192 /TAXON_ID=195065 /ORGANISM="Chroomonas mesostigmatica_cf, Strain CCMP1168" /LENGTH=108 /DNA_ID=CAMNT_0053684693 /DNA_START=229 /DNA_END=553 /DNA_ORIENTATION=-
MVPPHLMRGTAMKLVRALVDPAHQTCEPTVNSPNLELRCLEKQHMPDPGAGVASRLTARPRLAPTQCVGTSAAPQASKPREPPQSAHQVKVPLPFTFFPEEAAAPAPE